MSDTEATKGKASGWTDRERLAYLVSLIEHSDTKVNFKTAPLPAGRSLIACERMFGRLKTGLKGELDALKAGAPMPVSGAVANAGTGTGAGGGVSKKATAGRKRKGSSGESEEGGVKKKGKGKGKGEGKKVKEEKEEGDGLEEGEGEV